MAELIAEIGLNHLGEESRARITMAKALAARVDAITFQVREPKFYASIEASHRRLPFEFYQDAVAVAHRAGCRFGLAICDEAEIGRFNALGVDFWKVLSWDFGNASLRKGLQRTAKPIFFSTGLSSMEQIVAGSRDMKNSILIHTQLSQKVEDVNLKAIQAMKAATGLPVAFGLHCANHDVMKAALAFEPHSIFFYLKESGVEGLIDDIHAVPSDGLCDMVASLRQLTAAMGTGRKEAREAPAWVIP